MNGSVIHPGPALAIVLVVLLAAAALAGWLGQLGVSRAVLTAGVRAAVQLGAVSLLIAAVLGSPLWTALFVVGMYSVATATSARRVGGGWSGTWAGVPIAAGTVPTLALLLGSGALPARGVAVVPAAGILIGGAMTATSLAGRRALDELVARRGEYEAALALGLSARDSALLVCRPSAAQALVPALDQTRTVGLVALPGTFVGVLLGGAGPVQAGITQLLVLVALLAVEVVAVLVTVELVAADRFKAGPSRRTSRSSGRAGR